MAANQPQYYTPYLPSDSELSDADSDFTSSSQGSSPSSSPSLSPRPTDAEPEQDQGPNFAALAAGLAGLASLSAITGLARAATTAPAAGPTFATDTQELYYGQNRAGAAKYAAYDMQDISGLSLQTSVKETETVIMLQSRDRDRSIFPNPTSCHLNLPRRLMNITALRIAQINLTSAFFYFSPIKQNVDIVIYETDRITYPFAANSPVDSTGSLLPTTDSKGAPLSLRLTNTLRPGSYNIEQLLAELETQLNSTPLFYDFPEGFTSFLRAFSVSGDYSINFNYPGDTYYNALTSTFVSNPTRDYIVKFYFNSQYANLTSYQDTQVRIAYYYPVLKELLLDVNYKISTLTLSYPGYTTEQLVLYSLHNFTGLDDPIVGSIISANIPILDQYRLQHTFRYSLINRYICSYDKVSNRVNIQTTTLNTSLVNLLTTQYNAILSGQLKDFNLTAAAYAELSVQTTNTLSIIQSMYSFLQLTFAKYFAINYGTFASSYFAVPTNSLLLRQGLNAAGIAFQYDPAVTGNSRTSDLINDYRKQPPRYWTNMSNLGNVEGAQRNMGANSVPFPLSSNFPYNLAQSNIDITRPFINDSGDIYTDARRSAGDILVNVDPGKYTILQFRSQFRQTLQVETLPRQTQFMYPAYNKNQIIPQNLSNLFDISYCYVEPAAGSALFNKMMYPLTYNTIYGWEPTTLKDTAIHFGSSFTTSSNFWGSSSETLTAANSNGIYYKFQTPLPYTPAPSTTTTTYQINITFITATTFPSLLYAFFYHDQSAFNADVGPSNIRNESPYHYKYKLTISPGSSSNTYTFQTYANQTYYILLRPDSLSPNSATYKIIPWFTDSTYTTLQNITNFDPQQNPATMLNNYNVAIAQDSNFIRLPISPTLWENKSPATAPINALLGTAPPIIGYDINQVSNDLTDYVAFSPNNNTQNILPGAKICVDPTNNYVFQLNSAYSVGDQTYFPTGTNNALLTRFLNTLYIWKGASARQYKIVQYYSTTYIPDSSIALTYDPITDISPYINPYTLATTGGDGLSPFKYQGADNRLVLGSGLCGFTFLPGDGTWAVDRIMFKTNFLTLDPSKNKNMNIQILGVFFTSEVLSQAVSYINLQNAVAICVKQGDTLYNAATQNIGFDASYGTYSTFSNIPSLVSRTKFNITGFTQASKIFIPDSNAYYSIVAFSVSQAASNAAAASDWVTFKTLLSSASITYIQNLTGTPIPYPFANTPYTSKVFYGNLNYYATNDLVLSTSNGNSGLYGPPVGADESVSQYEQSIPIVNSHLHFLSPADIIAQPSSASPFSTWEGLPVQPTAIGTSIPNTLLLQASGFAIVNYTTYATVTPYTLPNRTFTLQGELSVQQIFPDHEVTSLLAFSGTTSDYIFLGASNIPGSVVSQLRFKRYTPSTGVMTELPINPYYTFSNSWQIQQFVFHNSSHWFLSATDQTNVYLRGDVAYASNPTTNTLITKPYAGKAVSELVMDCSGAYMYFATGTRPGITSASGFSSFQLFSFAPGDPGFVRTTGGYTITCQGSGIPSYFKQFSVDVTSTTEELIFTNTDTFPNSFFKVRAYQSGGSSLLSNAIIEISASTFQDSNKNLIVPTRIYGGAKGSKWVLFDSPPFIQGNRYDAYDAPISLSIAWQIMFPTIKIEMRKLSSTSTPITDLTSLAYPEWPHSAMFAYSSAAALSNDLSNPSLDGITPGSGKWGLESSNNFMVCDASFNGFQFNSYMMNVPLLPSASSTYYIAIRGWLPTEKFQTLLRFYLPNRYDFGFVRIQDLSGEIPLANSTDPTVIAKFNPAYLATLQGFNSNYVFTDKNFGSIVTQGFAGSNLSSTSFGSFLSKFISLYKAFNSNTTILQSIALNVQTNMNSFIASDLKYIIPATYQTRQRFTDPLLFKILWTTNLSPIYAVKDDEWGLGWNLGFAKADTGFSSIHTAPSFYKIQQDFIYLRLNPEFNINRMDAGGKENYAKTREPTGTTNQYYCKLLLTSFGGNATTFIHNPITFNPPLYSLKKLEFQWIDNQGNVLTNTDAEWDMTVNITETRFETTLPMLRDYNPGKYSGVPAALPPGLAISTMNS